MTRERSLLVLFTDGFWEAKSPDNQLFGNGRVVDVLRATAKLTARESIAAVRAAVADLCGHVQPVDDMEIVVVKVV